jgi:proline iminopeptidase
VPLPIPEPRQSGYTTRTPVPLYWAAFGPAQVSPLLVLHGGPGADQRYLQPQLLHLAERHDAVFYDQRGGGRSPSDSREPITWRTQVDDLATVVAEFGFDPPSVVGFSWGALLALLAAGAGAIRPRRLVLIAPAPVTRVYRAQFEAEMARRQEDSAQIARRKALQASGLRERDPEAYRQQSFEMSIAGYFARPERARDLTPFRVMGRVQQSIWESLGDFDIRPELAGVHCPALVIHGREDPVPLASSEDVAQALDAELVVIDDCGHVPYVEQPAACFRAIDRFLERTE